MINQTLEGKLTNTLSKYQDSKYDHFRFINFK